jgi:CBS domain-containing protein
MLEAARMMRDLGVGSLPICGNDDRLRGMITDRDIVVKCLAEERDASTLRAGELAKGTPHRVAADADLNEVLSVMEEHQEKGFR